jgi:hypothetical protein
MTMITYDTLVASLEFSWVAAGLHEHELIESVQPDTFDRTYKAELFPEHPEPLDEDTMPPWVEIHFLWSALHQLRSEGHHVDVSSHPIVLTWVYNVLIRGDLRSRSDHELVRMFQRAVSKTLHQYYATETNSLTPIAVEVRRIYHSDQENTELAYVQLVGPNVTDLSDMWNERDPHALRNLLQSEFDLASSVIQALSSTFTPPSTRHGSYRTVDTA